MQGKNARVDKTFIHACFCGRINYRTMCDAVNLSYGGHDKNVVVRPGSASERAAVWASGGSRSDRGEAMGNSGSGLNHFD